MLVKTSLLLGIGVAPLLAQNFLDPLFVTATRSDQAGSAAPYTTAYLDADFLRDNTRRTLPEALQYTPGVLVQKTAYGHGSPFIRGFTGRQNLLLSDGVRLNNSTFRSGPVQYWNSVDPLALDHIELIKSQGSVLYGSDAVGGTVNTFAKSPQFGSKPADQVYTSGSAFGEYRSNGQSSRIGRIEGETGIGGQGGILLGLSAKEFGDIEDSAIGRMKNTGYPEQDLDLRVDWAVSPGSTATFAHYAVNQDAVSRWHRTLNNPGWTHGNHIASPGKWTEDTFDQERSMSYLRHSGENPQAGAAIKRWAATLSFQTSDESEFQNRIGDPAAGSQPIRRSAIDVATIGIDLMLESPAGPGSMVYGLDFYHDEVNSSGSKNNLAGSNYSENLPLADDSQYDLCGIYAQYLWQALERLEITTGARQTYVAADLGRFAGGMDQSRDWMATVGSCRAIYSITPAWSTYGGFSQAFRAPNLDDLTGNLAAKSGATVEGDPSVDPEKFLTWELGARHHTDVTSINLAAFYTEADQLIVSAFTDVTRKSSIATNAGASHTVGIEMEGAWCFLPPWKLSGFVAWQEGRTRSPLVIGDPPENRPNTRQLPLSGSVALRWDHNAGKYWIEGRLLAAALEDRISAADQAADNQRIPTHGTPGYVVASLRAGWQVNRNLDLTCGIENLTDADYRNHGSGQNEPGLNGILGVKVVW